MDNQAGNSKEKQEKTQILAKPRYINMVLFHLTTLTLVKKKEKNITKILEDGL